MTSVVCQEFGCTPSQAEQEDIGECLEIIGLRRYAEAWRAVEDGMPQEELAERFGNSEALKNVITVQIKRVRGEID